MNGFRRFFQAERVKWRKDIARMMDFDPRIVIPGHCDAAAAIRCANEELIRCPYNRPTESGIGVRHRIGD